MNYSLYDIQKAIINIVKNDADFNTEATSIFGSDFKYFIDAHILDEDSELPSFVIYGLESSDERDSAEYVVQFVLTEIVEQRATSVDGINVYPTKKNLEYFGIKSLKLIENEIRNVGVNGKCNLKIAHKSLIMTPIGEADDVKVIITLTLEETKFI